MNIKGSCVIENGKVLKDGVLFFKSEATDLDIFLPEIYQHFHFSYPKFYKMDRLSKLGWLASEILLSDNFDKNNYQPEKIGVILANANSSLDNDIKYQGTIKDFPSPSVFVYTLPNIVIGEICIRNNFKGEHACYIQETFNAQFIYRQVAYLFDNDLLEACICGWVDVLGNDYKAVLFLVENTAKGNSEAFSGEIMDEIFKNN